MLNLKVDSLFQYVNSEEVEHEGEVCFKDCDLRLCSVLIFNKTLGKGHFIGDAISLDLFHSPFYIAKWFENELF